VNAIGMAHARLQRASSAWHNYLQVHPGATEPFSTLYKPFKFTSQNPPQKEDSGSHRAWARVERASSAGFSNHTNGLQMHPQDMSSTNQWICKRLKRIKFKKIGVRNWNGPGSSRTSVVCGIFNHQSPLYANAPPVLRSHSSDTE
jgi:hypothetical protein